MSKTKSDALRGRVIVVALLLIAGTASAATDTFSTLYTFSGGADGAGPTGGLMRTSDGSLFGTANGFNGAQFSTIFKITPTGTLSTIYTFVGTAEGQNPFVSLEASDGNLYGVTVFDGNVSDCRGAGCGTVFKATTAGALTTLYTFTGDVDGGQPTGLVQGSDGNLYGMTEQGGISADCGGSGCGTAFRVTTAGALSTLYSFSGDADGALGPSGGNLIAGSDGNLYGTTSTGGTSSACGQENPGCGTVFKLTESGTLTTLHTFSGGADGSYPGSLVQGADGNLYGTTAEGGGSGDGTVFRITPAGTLTTLYSFTGGSDEGSPDGLLQGSDGNFYGTTSGLGGASSGTIFELTSSGALTTLHSFAGTDGIDPYGMVQGGDGNLYGVVAEGSSSSGSVFKETLSVGSSSGGSIGGSSGSSGGGAIDLSLLAALGLAAGARRRKDQASESA